MLENQPSVDDERENLLLFGEVEKVGVASAAGSLPTGKAPDFKRRPRGPKSAGLSAVVLLFSSPETVRRAHSSASVEHQFAAKATGVLLRVHAMELGGVVSLTTRVPRSGTLLRYASK
jgi:hypothetical protein